ncbi:MAG: helix-turn-helix domain-containing protein, partial [Spirochaetota bacterium]
ECRTALGLTQAELAARLECRIAYFGRAERGQQNIRISTLDLFFAALNVGSIQLPIVLRLDSSLAGVLQGCLVLFVILAQGAKERFLSGRSSTGKAPDPAPPGTPAPQPAEAAK